MGSAVLVFCSWTHLDRAAPFFDTLSLCNADKGTARTAQNIVLGWTWILWRRRRPRVWEDSCFQGWPGSWKFTKGNITWCIYAPENRPQTIAPCLIKKKKKSIFIWLLIHIHSSKLNKSAWTGARGLETRPRWGSPSQSSFPSLLRTGTLFTINKWR